MQLYVAISLTMKSWYQARKQFQYKNERKTRRTRNASLAKNPGVEKKMEDFRQLRKRLQSTNYDYKM